MKRLMFSLNVLNFPVYISMPMTLTRTEQKRQNRVSDTMTVRGLSLQCLESHKRLFFSQTDLLKTHTHDRHYFSMTTQHRAAQSHRAIRCHLLLATAALLTVCSLRTA